MANHLYSKLNIFDFVEISRQFVRPKEFTKKIQHISSVRKFKVSLNISCPNDLVEYHGNLSVLDINLEILNSCFFSSL